MSVQTKVQRVDGGDTVVLGSGGKLAGGGSGVPAPVSFHRQRVTVARVNAGATLLAAPGAGYAYRLVDVNLIAIGGAASGATTVDILATLATASRKLLAAAVAGLTQSTVLRAGAANAAVLADGASFTVNDENTA